jgi:3-deoxy-D-manno-octulosonic-acid transferase
MPWYALYGILLTALLFVLAPSLALAKRFRRGLRERLAIYPIDRLDRLAGKRPIWIHGASVGEVLSAKNFSARLKERFPDRALLFSTVTAAGYEMARRVLSVDAVIFFPIDHPWIVRRALDIVNPSAVIFLETEIWPNFLRVARRKGVPCVLVSGRISPRAFRRYSLLRGFFASAVGNLVAAGMQTAEDADRLVGMGLEREKVRVTGNLKRAAVPNSPEPGKVGAAALLGDDGDRRVWIAGSTHAGEEKIVLDVFSALRDRLPSLRLVLAPRHPQRFGDVERLLKNEGVRYGKRSDANGRPEAPPEVILLDTLGELPLFYALADVVFVGGSLVDAGGHNLIEPARFRKPIVFGPCMANFRAIADEMTRRGGAVEVRGKEDLLREVESLLSDRERARRMGERAFQAVAGDASVMEQTLELVFPFLRAS